jgi:hypothetical protein
MNIALEINRLLGLLGTSPEAEDGSLVRSLMEHGVPYVDAERLLAFVPMACGRALLAESGATFPDGYEVRDLDSGRTKKGRLSNEPVFVAAQSVVAQRGTSDAQVRAAAARSAEMHVARQLLRPGETASNIRFTESVLLRLPLEAVTSIRPWWRPW